MFAEVDLPLNVTNNINDVSVCIPSCWYESKGPTGMNVMYCTVHGQSFQIPVGFTSYSPNYYVCAAYRKIMTAQISHEQESGTIVGKDSRTLVS